MQSINITPDIKRFASMNDDQNLKDYDFDEDESDDSMDFDMRDGLADDRTDCPPKKHSESFY
jgi:hypothetical protein